MKYVTNCDMLDVEKFETALLTSNVASSLDTSESRHDMLCSAFSLFVKYAPRILDAVPAERKLHQHVAKEITQLAEYKELRQYTQADSVTAIGALSTIKDLLASIPEDVQKVQNQIETEAADLEALLDSDSANVNPEAIKQHIARLKTLENMLNIELAEAQDEIRSAVRVGMAQATKDAQANGEAVQALGYGNANEVIPNVAAGDKAKVATWLANNPKLKEIMLMAGRLTRIAEAQQRQKTDNAKNTIDGVETGSNIADVLPSEIALLADEDLESDFFRRYSEDALLQYKLSGKEKIGKGPIVSLVDCSGSMNGLPDVWSKGITLAMYRIAQRQNRDFAVILFNHQVWDQIFIPKGTKNPEALVRILSAGTSGGTDFETPLDAFLAIVKDKDPKADAIFITDGLCNLNPQWLEQYKAAKAKLQFRVHSIVIGCDNGTLASFSDTVTPLDKAGQRWREIVDINPGLEPAKLKIGQVILLPPK